MVQYLNNTNWKTLISRDLLYCLIAHPNGLTREEIGAISGLTQRPAN